MRNWRKLAAVVCICLGITSCSKRPVDYGPPKTVCANRAEALEQATAFSKSMAGTYVTATSGTPSMEPLIHGVCFVVMERQPYAAVKKFDVLEYWGRLDANSPKRTLVLHRAVLLDSAGWIMSGDNNMYSESWDRLTALTYIGTAIRIFQYAP